MLSQIEVYNYVLIDNNSLHLSNKFNVFTGETGAGKSLLVDSLNFVCGQRSSASVVGRYDSFTRVEAVFNLDENHKVNKLLKDLDLYEEDQLILSREMTQDGRSTSRLNGRISNLSTVREVSSYIIDIHSQHETQYLLKKSMHLDLFDVFCESENLLEKYTKEYKSYQSIKKEKQALLDGVLDPEAIDFARFQLKELEELNPSHDDYDMIESRLNLMKNFEKYQKLNLNINHGLDKALEHLYEILESFEQIDNQDMNSRFKDIYYQLDDLNRDFESDSDELVFDEFEFDSLNSRMFFYSKMIRKYGSLDSMLDKIAELKKQLNEAEDYDYILQDIDKRLLKQEKKLAEAANELSKHRYKNKSRLEKEIQSELKDLLLENARFEVRIKEKDFDSKGIDDVEFFVAMNKGSEFQELSKVASGGELSRLMLGLKVIFSSIYGISTIVFDEIDTGVSGKAANSIAKKMKDLSKNTQVISITHLSTVASYANNHFLILKEEEDNANKTVIEEINDGDRIKELAMMMSGNINPSSLDAAEVLLKKGQEY